jgi:dihydrofolate synthase/folylpolyglutamate synthase
MGGRLDSTNVCQPVVSVITTISFDHMKQLGNTLASIAREKAGIIKPGVPVVSGVVDEEPRRVIAAAATERSARLFQLGEHFDATYQPPRDMQANESRGRMDYIARAHELAPGHRQIELGLLGRHQATNAAVAIAAASQLRARGWTIPELAVREGLAGVRWPARVELVSRRPTVIVDAAHNVASIRSLVATLEESFTARRRWLVFATTLEKPVREMLEILLPRFDGVVLTRYLNNPRCVPVEELAAQAAAAAAHKDQPRQETGLGSQRRHEPVSTQCAPAPSDAWRCVQQLASPDDLVCVTGSFFLAAEIRQLINASRSSDLGAG